MLPSQTGRTSSSRSHMYRRGRRRRLPVIIALAVVLIGGGGLFYKWRSGGGTPVGAAEQTPSNANPKPGTDASLTSSHTSAPPAAAFTNHPPAPKPETPALPKPDPKPEAKVDPKPEMKPSGPSITMGGTGAPANPTATAGSAAQPPQGSASNAPSAASGMAAPGVNKPNTPLQSSTPGSNPGAAPNNPAGKTPTANPPTTPPSTPPMAANPPAAGSGSSKPAAQQRLQAGLDLIAQNKPVEARKTLTAALLGGLSAADADRARTEMSKLNQKLVFGPDVVAGDPFVKAYAIESGDSLARLPKKLNLDVDWRLLQRINNISAPERIQLGQRIKVITGPFSVVVTKADFRMDLYLGTGSDRVFVRSFKVGLGKDNGTPEGEYIVKPNSKLINPAWSNPRTGEHFEPNDPKNPLGEYWIGIIGVSDNIRGLESYGIHGTIDPDSIGKMMSMGCIRLADEDIKLIYELLMDTVSHVEVHGEEYP